MSAHSVQMLMFPYRIEELTDFKLTRNSFQEKTQTRNN